MDNIINIQSASPLLGTWRACDTFDNVWITVSVNNENWEVSVTDTEDSETAEVYDIRFDPDQHALSFSCHWKSTGRFVNYKLQCEPKDDRMNVTYTYTTTETWERVKN